MPSPYATLAPLPPSLLAVMEADHLIEIAGKAEGLEPAALENLKDYLTKLSVLAIEVRERL